MSVAARKHRQPREFSWARSHAPARPDSFSGQPASAARLAGSSLALVDLGLAAAIFAVPLAMGGRQAVGQLALFATVGLAAVGWCLHQAAARPARWRLSWAELLLVAMLVVAALQLVPLPPRLYGALAPKAYATLPLWCPATKGPTLGTWQTVSLAPVETRQALAVLAAFAVLFYVTAQRVRHGRDAERLATWVAWAAVSMACFGLVQYLFSNGRFFWFYEHPYTDTAERVKGSFTNANHFAHFLAAGVGAIAQWMLAGGNRRLGVGAIGLAICLFAALLTLSRGGALALAAAVLVTGAILYGGRLARGKVLGASLGVALLALVALGIHGFDRLATRLGDFQSVDRLDVIGARRALWQADLRATADYPWTGTGLGSHRHVYPIYLDAARVPRDVQFTHAENGYLQLAMEAGPLGLALALGGFGLAAYWCWVLVRRRSRHDVAVAAALGGALSASAVHSWVDYVWYVPGCMIPLVILAACASALARSAAEDRVNAASRSQTALSIQPRNRTGLWSHRQAVAWIAAGLVALAGFGWSAADRWSAAQAEILWHRHLIRVASSDTDGPATKLASRQPTREPRGDARQVFSALLGRQPVDAQAHQRLAEAELEEFHRLQQQADNAFDLRQIREAALASSFPSRAALHAWLGRAVGTHRSLLDSAWRHARRAVELCPLDGGGYILLAELSFLEGPEGPGKAAYVAQAERVRPYDGAVLFHAGSEAVLAGDLTRAAQCWRRSFRAGLEHEQRLVDLMAGQMPLAVLIEILQPDLASMRRIVHSYAERSDASELADARRHLLTLCLAEACQTTAQASAARWIEAAELCRLLSDPAGRVDCLRRAARADGSNYALRFALGRLLLDTGQAAEAEEHLRWCASQRPLDRAAQKLRAAALDRTLRRAF